MMIRAASPNMIREVSFSENKAAIVRLRREAYAGSLVHEVDEFDPVAHHFALFDTKQQMIGAIRALRSDEVPRLELQRESRAHGLVLPRDRLIIEVSRGCTARSVTEMPLIKLARAMNDYARRENAQHIVSKTSPRLLTLYRSMGFRVFGKPFYSDWFYDFENGDSSIPIIFDIVKPSHAIATHGNLCQDQEEEEVLVW